MKLNLLVKTCFVALLLNASAHAQTTQRNQYNGYVVNPYQQQGLYNQGGLPNTPTGGSNGITGLNNPVTNHPDQQNNQSQGGTFGARPIATPPISLPTNSDGCNGLNSVATNTPGGLTASSLNNLAMGQDNSNVASLRTPGQPQQGFSTPTGNTNCPKTSINGSTVNTPGSMVGDVMFGQATSVDGLNFKLNGKLIKLSGVDAPMKNDMCPNGYLNWKCGELVHNRLEGLLENKPIRCVIQNVTANETGVICTLGLDSLSKTLLLQGLAYTTEPTQSEFMQQAKSDLRGMWSQGIPERTMASFSRR